ncbi:AAA family ATPase [Kribbella sp. NPDC051952]|uniref:AAA family ATPase n=1 Tax=Kribbella sp. NPDC051952 TaxID=3154851 RepID=UPI003424823A
MTAAQALLLSGVGGAGKTTIAQAVAGLLTAEQHPTGVLDLDAVAQFGPKRAGPALHDRAALPGLGFHDQLRVHNLAAVWATYRDVGARFMVVSGPVDTADERAAYTWALEGCDVRVVRLETAPEVIAERTRDTRGPEWDLQAALAVKHEAVQDFTVSNDREPEATAVEVLGMVGWPGG